MSAVEAVQSALPLARWLIGAWLLHLSVVLVVRGSSGQLMLLGVFEAVAAVLFMIRRTTRLGGLLLLLAFAFAAGFHLRAGERVTLLLFYTVAVAALALCTTARPRPAQGPGLTKEDRSFLRAFEGGALSPADFHHRDHLRAAWATLIAYPLPEALARFGQALRALAARAGKPGVYHETITWAYLLLINERLAAGSRDLCFADFAARNSDLFTWKPSILESYYRSDILASDLARRVFVLPGHVNRLENQ